MAMATLQKKQVKIREVFEHNLEFEFLLINSVLNRYPIVAIDTEFPGVTFESEKHFSTLTPAENYELMKKNVDVLKLIQVGLSLSDSEGNLPDFRTDYGYIWEFNFREFDVHRDEHNPKSIQLLKEQGIDFAKNRKEGIEASHFAKLFSDSELGSSAKSFVAAGKEIFGLTWVMFHGMYDVGYLIKLLTQKELPSDHLTFMLLVRIYLGNLVFDVKEMIRPLGLRGGLEKIACCLGVAREAGKSHQGGSDSLLTLHTFIKLLASYKQLAYQFNHQVYGLQVDSSVMKNAVKLLRRNSSTRLDHILSSSRA